MSITPESLIRLPSPETRRVTSEQARDIVAAKITKIVDNINSGANPQRLDGHSYKDHDAAHAVLFGMSHEDDSVLESDANETLIMQKGVLQQVALEVMAQFGFDEGVSERIAPSSPSFELRVYPSQSIDRLVFQRLLMTTEQGEPFQVTWSAYDSEQLLPTHAIDESILAS